MAHKKKHDAPVPPGNAQHGGPGGTPEQASSQDQTAPELAPQEQDPKRRIGDFTGTAEHPFVQPGGRYSAKD